MVKVSVVSTKEVFKYISKVIIFIIGMFAIISIFKYSEKHFANTEISANKCIAYITEEITAMGSLETNNFFEVKPEKILESELRMSKSVTSRNSDSVQIAKASNEEINVTNTENITAEPKPEVSEKPSEIKEVSTNVQVEPIDSGYKSTYNFECNGVKIKNETDYNLSELNLNSNIKLTNKNVIIFHTHTCESYTPTQANSYEASGNFRTTDSNYNVVKVGDELKKYLNNYGFNVIHNTTYHDYPTYSSSYGRSLKTVKEVLKQNPNTDIIIDVHRDAIGDDKYAPKVKIGDEYVAQMMFVIGTNGSGLEHDNWKQNLEFAIKVQQKANELYPGLFKPIILRDSRYNQHLSSAATIIEFGATGNTLEECMASSKYLAKILDEVMK